MQLIFTSAEMDRSVGLAVSGLARALLAAERWKPGVSALAVLATWEQDTGYRLDDFTRRTLDAGRERAWRALGAEGAAIAWERGRRQSLPEAAPSLLAALKGVDDRPRRSPAPPAARQTLGLTRQEQRVLCLVAAGMSNQQIADALIISLLATASGYRDNSWGAGGEACRRMRA